MALNLPTFYKRTGSAIVFAIIMLTGLLWNTWAFLALVCLIHVLCFYEYTQLMKRIYYAVFFSPGLMILFQAAGLLLIASACLMINGTGETIPAISGMLFKAFCTLPALLILLTVLPEKQSFHSLLLCFGGVLYLTLPMIYLLYMYQVNTLIPLALIVMIWINDTMAYLVGSFIGKTPFSPISPKKTWEGTAGGAILTVAAAAIYGYYAHNYRMQDWMALAVCAAVAGTLGDLLESKLKRMADVKDSGRIMPGHGGALDRFDSLLIATPFAFLYVYYFMH